MSDVGHELTDALLADMEKKIAREYAQASLDVQAKLDDYLRRFEIKDEIWRKNVANGTRSEAEYKQWRTGQMIIGKRWEALRDELALEYHDANVTARRIVDGYTPEVYALNHNFGTYEVEKGGLVDTSYTLYSRDTVERIMREDPDILPPPGKNMQARIAAGKDIAWQEGQIQSVTMQSILQGESIPNMSKRIATTIGETNHKSTIRYARTAVTGAQNAGRQDAYKRAESLGVKMKREWVATLDNRTRHEHRLLDGMKAEVDEPFVVEGYEIMFPGDPTAEGFLIWNCRCTTVADVDGWEDISGQLRSYEAIGDMSYEEWLEAKPEYQSITHQEEVGEAMRRSYIRELYGGKGIYSVDSYTDALDEIRKEDLRAIIEKKFADAPESFRRALIDSVDSMSPEMLEIVSRTSGSAEIYYFDGSGTCQKIRGSDTIYMYRGNQDEEEFVGAFWHEYGHLTDKSSNGGFTHEVRYTDRRGVERSYTVSGIAGITEQDGKYAQAVADDLNAFLKRYGLDGKYESGVSEWGGRYFRVVGGDYIDPLNMPFEQSKELSEALTTWVREFSGQREAWDYLYTQGYPRNPEWSDYFETYTTPSRHLVRTRERYKGSTIDWQDALRATSDAQDAFAATHDMTSLFAEQRRLQELAEAKANKLGFVTDTFDEGAFGAFCSVATHGGHTAEYYMQGGHDEYIANIFSALATGDETILSGLQDICPNLFSLVRGVILG